MKEVEIFQGLLRQEMKNTDAQKRKKENLWIKIIKNNKRNQKKKRRML